MSAVDGTAALPRAAGSGSVTRSGRRPKLRAICAPPIRIGRVQAKPPVITSPPRYDTIDSGSEYVNVVLRRSASKRSLSDAVRRIADWLSVPNGVNARASNVAEAPLKAIGAPMNLVGTPLIEIGSPFIVTGCPSTLLTPEPNTL